MATKIKDHITISFFWNGTAHEITLYAKDFNLQLDRFYADFEIDGEYFYFEDDLDDDNCPCINIPGVWHFIDEEEEEYFQNLHKILNVA